MFRCRMAEWTSRYSNMPALTIHPMTLGLCNTTYPRNLAYEFLQVQKSYSTSVKEQKCLYMNTTDSNHDGARLPPKWVTFFLHGGFKRAKGCGYLGEGILGLTGQLKPRFVTLHTKTRLIKHDNLGKTGFQRGFKLPKPGLYRAPNCL